MKSIEQINKENDTKSLISSFIALIGLGALAKKVNFKRKSIIGLPTVISWLMSIHFARHSLFRATLINILVSERYVMYSTMAALIGRNCFV